MNALMKFVKDEDGLTAVEYVIGAGLLAVALSTLFSSWGTRLDAALDAVKL